MSCIERLSKNLRTQGFRMTPQRLSILEVLHHGGHITPGQVHELVSQQIPGITESTVYRTLEFLTQKGILFSTSTTTGHLTYELADNGHHHIVCMQCGAHLDLAQTIIADFILNLEQKTNYHLNTGHLTFFGLCPACMDSD